MHQEQHGNDGSTWKRMGKIFNTLVLVPKSQNSKN